MHNKYKAGDQVVIKISRDSPLYMMQVEEREGAWLHGSVDWVDTDLIVFHVPMLQTDYQQLVITDYLNTRGITVVKKVPAGKRNHK